MKKQTIVSTLALLGLSACGGGGGGGSSSSGNGGAVPVASADGFSTEQDVTLSNTVATNDTASSSGGNEWLLVSDVDNGSLTFRDDGSFTYQPETGFFGTDEFRYRIEDQEGGVSATVTASITVNSDEIVADPLIEHQWYLENIGQNALADSGGVAGADIRLADAASSNYALGYTGNGVQIAVVDNGVDINHDDLSLNVVQDGSYNFFSSENESNDNGKGLHDPTPQAGVSNPSGHHGTAVAGLVSARGGNGIGIWGVAPKSELVGYNLLNEDYTFNLNHELAALGYADSVEEFAGLYSETTDVFNLSYGRNPYQGTNEYPTYSPEILAGLKYGAENLRDGKGAIYVKAAGNEYDSDETFGGTGWCQQARDNNITCYNTNMENENVSVHQMVIGGFNADDERSSYSNTGANLWLSAPAGEYGVDKPAMMTTDASGCTLGFSQNAVDDEYPYNQAPFDSDFNTGGNGNESCDYFSGFNGTSSATPMVSGVAALLLEANPSLTWRDVKHILATTARQIDSDLADNTTFINTTQVTLEAGWVENDAGFYFSNHFGFGAVDAEAAIQMAEDWKNNNTHLANQLVSSELNGVVPTSGSDNHIPDNDASGLTTGVTVSSDIIVESVELVVTIDDLDGQSTDTTSNKIDMSDYQLVLTSPAGTESVVLTPYNAYQSGHDMDELKLLTHAFYGEDAEGDWTLTVRDLDDSTDNRINHAGEGQLESWTLKIYGR